MKKLAFAFASLCLAATPVLACPHDEAAAPKTADKKEAPKKEADKAKTTDTSKTAKPTDKAAPKAPAAKS